MTRFWGAAPTLVAIALSLLAPAALATPPAKETKQARTSDKVPAEPAIELRMEGRNLKYTYDLSRLFDKALWRVLEDYGYSEITVEVRLMDDKAKVRTTHYHTLKLELLDNGRVRVMTSPRRGKVYKTRDEMLRAFTRVKGKPIRAKEFGTSQGHLELTVLVNPVSVYSFPESEAPVAAQEIVPKTYYDRKLELRSNAVNR